MWFSGTRGPWRGTHHHRGCREQWASIGNRSTARCSQSSDVIQISHPFKLVSRQLRQTRTVVDVRGIKIGKGDLVVIAGPCSVESEEQLMETARAVKAAGA